MSNLNIYLLDLGLDDLVSLSQDSLINLQLIYSKPIVYFPPVASQTNCVPCQSNGLSSCPTMRVVYNQPNVFGQIAAAYVPAITYCSQPQIPTKPANNRFQPLKLFPNQMALKGKKVDTSLIKFKYSQPTRMGQSTGAYVPAITK